MEEHKHNQPSIILHRHPAELLPVILMVLMAFLAGGLLVIFLPLLGLPFSPVLGGWVVLFGGLYLIGLLGSLVYEWMVWYLDFWLLVDTPDEISLVDVELLGFFRHRIAELPLAAVQDVLVERRGFLANLFRYGDIRVQSAGKEGFFLLRSISQPAKVRERILELASRAKARLAEQQMGHAPTIASQEAASPDDENLSHF